MDTWNKTGITSTIPASAEPSLVISLLAIAIGGVVTLINVVVLVAAIKCSPLKQNAHFILVVGLTATDICSGLALFTLSRYSLVFFHVMSFARAVRFCYHC